MTQIAGLAPNCAFPTPLWGGLGSSLRAVEDVLRAAPLFVGVDTPDVDALIERFEMISVLQGSVITAQGDRGESLYVVLAGRVKLGRSGTDDRVNLTGVIGPAEQFAEPSVFDDGPNTVTATAIADSALARLARDELQAWLAARPHLAPHLLRLLARRLRRSDAVVSDLMFLDVPGRVAKQLLDLARRFGVGDSRALLVAHGLTQEELAQLVGASRETVNKTLADFAGRGWVQLDTKCVVILDPDRLARRARQGAR